MQSYLLADVLRYVPRVTRSQTINLTAKQVVAPDLVASTGTGHQRQFSFFNLIEFAIASELVRVGVEAYAIAQILRGMRWLIGDPRGLESWTETFMNTSPRRRERLDRRLYWIVLDPLFRFSAEWLNDPAPDLSELDPDERAHVESVRARVMRTGPPKLSNKAEEHAIRAMLRESPYAKAGIQAWEHFQSRATRPAHFFLIIWPANIQEFRQLTSRGVVESKTQARWVFDFASSPEELTELTTESNARIVLNLRQIVTDLEDDTGELLEQVERERLGDPASARRMQ